MSDILPISQTPDAVTPPPQTDLPFIPLSEPCLGGNEWEYVRECLDTGWISSVGSFVNQFEEQLATRVGAKHAVATVNGTAALHTALLASGVQPGDEVLVSTLTFIASANAIRYCGAVPVFIDAEPDYWQMDPQLVREFLTKQCHWQHGELRNRVTGRRVSAVMPVHVLGHPVDLDAIAGEARRFELKIVEDAAESLGADYQSRPVGTGSDVVCFSFNGNKTITCGGGGMIVTSDQEIASRCRYLTTQAKDDPVEYVHNEVGYNYRMTNVLAAIGLAQLELLDQYVDRRRTIAQYYQTNLALPGLHWYREAADVKSTCWLSTALVDPAVTGCTAVELRDWLQQQRIQTRRLWQPMHQSPAHRHCQAVLTGVADRLFETALSFPSSPNLTDASLQRV
ncbi:MAG: LegC family aminotransferase, partial [Planctomycetaceae bacterium]|nr:LegC family aminotransferase [Planctomycetaceae bacterium]